MHPDQLLEKVRILILFPHLVTPGGALNYTLRLAGELAAKGAKVAIICLRAESDAFQARSGVEIIALKGPVTSSLRYWLLFPWWQTRINRTIAAWHPDVIVAQVFPSNWWGWLYKRRYPDTKLVWVCHEPSAFVHSQEVIKGLRPFWKRWLAKCLQPLLRPVDLQLARKSDRVVANSRYTAEQYKLVYGRKTDGIATPGIDLELFSSDGGPRERALITVAHLVRYKRIDFLLKVFSCLQERYPELVMHIVGEGDTARELAKLVGELNIRDGVIFHGTLPHVELATLLRKMTLFLFAGVNETFGMAPLEAIACGTPVVAHASGGPREFVSEKCGRLIASMKVEDWTEAISAYLDFLQAHPAFPAEVSECARNFDWHQTLRPAVEIIAELAGASGDDNLTIRSGKNRFARQ